MTVDGSPPRAVGGEFDLALPADGGFWAIWLNLIAAEDEEEARQGFSDRVAQHMARRCTVAGDCGPLIPLGHLEMIRASARAVPGGPDGSLTVITVEGENAGDLSRLDR